MQGLMMDDYSLTLTRLLERARTYFPHKRILTKAAEGDIRCSPSRSPTSSTTPRTG